MIRKQYLASLIAFVGKEHYVIDVINLCHLYPLDSWKVWIDYNGYKIRVYKTVVRVFRYEKEKIITDIYQKSPIDVIIRQSNFRAFYKDKGLLWLIDNDRIRLFKNNVRVSVLSEDISLLKIVIKSFKLKDYSEKCGIIFEPLK